MKNKHISYDGREKSVFMCINVVMTEKRDRKNIYIYTFSSIDQVNLCSWMAGWNKGNFAVRNESQKPNW